MSSRIYAYLMCRAPRGAGCTSIYTNLVTVWSTKIHKCILKFLWENNSHFWKIKGLTSPTLTYIVYHDESELVFTAVTFPYNSQSFDILESVQGDYSARRNTSFGEMYREVNKYKRNDDILYTIKRYILIFDQSRVKPRYTIQGVVITLWSIRVLCCFVICHKYNSYLYFTLQCIYN